MMVSACADSAGDGIHDPSDLEWDESNGKTDSGARVYNPDWLVSHDAFIHSDAFTTAQVQDFLEETPYKRRSFLADVDVGGGKAFSQAVVEIADEYQLNPLVLLVTLQKESGLIAKSAAPNQFRVDFAFGCGCADGRECLEQFRGLDKQLACAADQLRSYLDEIDTNGQTRVGWAPGKTKSTLDPIRVTPRNKATAALYTYTPWSLYGAGGNWLFWNVWNRYSDWLGYDLGTSFAFNEGFIGGACETDIDCTYSGGRCVYDNSGNGVCSMDCDRSCPDASGATTSFCIGGGDGGGMCVAECGAAGACGPNQICMPSERYNEPSVVRPVCVPGN